MWWLLPIRDVKTLVQANLWIVSKNAWKTGRVPSKKCVDGEDVMCQHNFLLFLYCIYTEFPEFPCFAPGIWNLISIKLVLTPLLVLNTILKYFIVLYSCRSRVIYHSSLPKWEPPLSISWQLVVSRFSLSVSPNLFLFFPFVGLVTCHVFVFSVQF